MSITSTDTGLLRLLQLSSAALPVGGYAFSHGLEYAIEVGWIKNQLDVHDCLHQQVHQSLALVDVPLLKRQLNALCEAQCRPVEKGFDRDVSTPSVGLAFWNAYALACRESSELRLTDTAMGTALIKLLKGLNVDVADVDGDISYVTAFAIAASHWGIEPRSACFGLLWSWLENQVAAATKLIPLGQTQAQGLLDDLLREIPTAVDSGYSLQDDELGASLPGLAMASTWHETQYSRLFRS